MNQISISMQLLSPLILENLEENRKIVLTVTGNSMRPFLKHKRDQVILSRADKNGVKVNDVVLYLRQNGTYVLHRIVSIDNGKITMLGDAQTLKEPGIELCQIKAIATAFIRKGKTYNCDGKLYHTYVSLWTRLVPLRPIYFKLYKLAATTVHKLHIK